MKTQKFTDEEIMDVKNIHIPQGCFSMNELISKFGIKNKIIYFNNVEKKTKDIKCPFVVVEKIIDKGIELSNGIEIAHVTNQAWKQISCDIIKKRHRDGITLT